MSASSATLDRELVSVVVPTRNRRVRLLTALASVKAQTWPDIEIIVVVDGSTDGTFEHLAEMAARDRALRVLRNRSARGAAQARNQGISVASGRWVAFLDDDDWWLPAKLEKQLHLLKHHGGASAVSCSFFVKRPLRGRRLTRVVAGVSEQQMLERNCFGGTSTCLTSARVLHEIGGFDGMLRSRQDWDLWLRLIRYGPILVCDEPLVIQNAHLGRRISNDIPSRYAGRRRAYFMYRRLMTADTRCAHLAALLRCRVLLDQRRMRRGLGTVGRVVRLGRFRSRVAFLRWYASRRLIGRALGHGS